MSESSRSSTGKGRTKKASPTKYLDEAAQQRFCAVLALGCSRKTAADYLGSRPATVRQTARKNVQFAEQLARSEAVCEVSALTQLGKALKDERNWRAVTWLLERRNPDRYGRRKPRTASPRQVAEVMNQLINVVAVGVRDPDDRRRIVERLQAVVEGLHDYDESAD